VSGRRDAARARDRPRIGRIGRIGRLERGRGVGDGTRSGAIVYGTPGIGPDGCVEEEVHPLDGRPGYTRRVPAAGWDLAVARGAGGAGPSSSAGAVGRKR
jgi:hypothetical protein